MQDHALAAVTGALQFAADLGDAAFLHFVRSDVSAATIVEIDTARARSLAGVIAVFTATDLALPRYGQIDTIAEKYRQPPLVTDTVSFAGERIVAIVAQTQAIALDAEEMVTIRYESVRPVLDPLRSPITFTATEQLSFDDPATPATVELTARIPRLSVAPLETVSAVAEPLADGRTRLLVGTQLPQRTHGDLCRYLDLAPDQLELAVLDAGGAFGGKTTGGSPDLTILVACSRRLDRRIRYVEPRSANLATMQARDQLQHLVLRAEADGIITSIDLDVLCNAGAYAGSGTIEPAKTAMMASGPYVARSVHTHTRSVHTNTAPTGAYRGPGRAEATAILERGLDRLATELRIDPIELRRRNLLRTYDFPYKTPSGELYDAADYRATLDSALLLAGADTVRSTQARLRDARSTRCIGLGVATWVDATAGWESTQQSCASLDRDGTVRLIGGGASGGQGHEETLRQLTQDIVGIEACPVVLDLPRSDQPVESVGSFGSRTGQIVGSSVSAAVRELHRKVIATAADLLEASPADVVQDGTHFAIRGVPSRTVTWYDVAIASHDEVDDTVAPGLWSIGSFEQDNRTHPSGCHVAVVQVDAETGAVELIRVATATDCGTVLHDPSARDQARGAMAQGAGQALYEEVVYDEAGNLLTASLADYGAPSAADLPALDVRFAPTPTDRNPLGVKGIAETGMLGTPPAIQNAIIDALSHLGVRHIDMPCTPFRVWAAIQAARGDQRSRAEV